MTGKVKALGQVFTPSALVNELLDKLPQDLWLDPSKTWLDNSAGSGNFLVEVKRRLIASGHSEAHVLEHMIFAVELDLEHLMTLQQRLGYLVNGQPNPILDPKHFSTDKLSKAARKYSNGVKTYLHHRNCVCEDALAYDYSFDRHDDRLQF